jgi:hypothetical protein
MFKIILPRFLFKIERWKWNPEYRIYVSNMGHFKNEYKQDLPIRIGKKNGYCGIIVPNFGFKYAHRLVMLTWKPIPDAENLTVDHLDHNKRNNAVDNLEWVTKEENLARAQEDLYNDAATAQEISIQDKEIKNPIGFAAPKTARYKAGKKLIFNSLDEAAQWCFEQSNGQVTLEQIKKKIETKCVSGATYFGRKWKKVQ